MSLHPFVRLAALLAALLPVSAAAQRPRNPPPMPKLTAAETRLRAWIGAHRDEQIETLQKMVDIPSGTLNLAGVRKVGALFRAELDALGFTTRWVDLPEEMHRAGHLVAERAARRRNPGARRLLLIGHFDTVFEGEGQKFARTDSIARGAGTSDMKGGDVVLLYALKALAAEKLLDQMDVTVVVTGDEELAGLPIEVTRKALIDAARVSDVALAFEGGSRELVSISRRGASEWALQVTGRQAHSSGMFSPGTGFGAIYEAARILTAFRESLSNRPGLSFNPGLIAGGANLTADTSGYAFQVDGKSNIISPVAVVRGDLRFVTEGQKDSARAVMREIVAKGLAGTSARIEFQDKYPAMPATAAGEALLARFDTVSRALGYPAIRAQDATRRGAGDLSFVAPYIPGMDGMGPLGNGAHSPAETVHLPSLVMQTERAAVLMARLAGIRK